MTSAPDFVVAPEFYDVGWDRLPEPEKRGGLLFFQVQSRSDWIVKLQFTQGGEDGSDTKIQTIDPRSGTGFYVNIPEAKHYVIMTAGHNLIDTKGNLSQHLEILPLSAGEPPIKPKPADVFISASYKKTPGEVNAEDDYGVILIPKDPKDPPRGFGFALKLGHDDLTDEELNVSGYREGTDPGKPVTSTGECLACRPNQLEYFVKTEKGLSGSPVFIAYKGNDTAIAIHNYGPQRPTRGSRGTRLNEKVLGEIFSWLNVGYLNKSLKVFPSRSLAPPPNGLYLRFLPDKEYAWVRLGDDGLETRFDILPAYAPPPGASLSNSSRFVFRFRLPPGWPHPEEQRWVLWDVVRNGVTLTDTLQEFCLSRIVPDQKKNKDSFYVVLEKPGGLLQELAELRVQASEITQEDIEWGTLDTPEVSFEKHLKGKKVMFNIFCFH